MTDHDAGREDGADVPEPPAPSGELADQLILARARIAAGGRMGRLPRVGDGIHTGVNLLESYAMLTAVALARAEFYGDLLERQVFAQASGRETDEHPTGGPAGMGGLIGFTGVALLAGPVADQDTHFVATGEQVRALVELEGRERDRAAALIEKAVKMGIRLDQAETLRTYARTVSTALQAMMGELGLPMSDEAALRSAKRAGLTARRVMGQDDGDPDIHIGPAATPAERVRVLEAALRQARRDQQAVEAGTS